MGAPPYALSISHFVSSVGADAGFAAIIGLAILVLLYFAQARETASLRDRFAEAAEQVRQLELRVAHLSRPAPAAALQPKVAPRPVAATSAPLPSRTVHAWPISEVPMAPAGVGAPALSAATRMIPSGDEGAIAIRSGAARVRVGAGVAAAAGVAVAEAEDAGSGPDDADGVPQASGGGGVMAPPGPAPAPAPATAAAAAAGVGAAAGGGSPAGPTNGGGRTPAPAPAAGARTPSGQANGGSGTGAPPRPGEDPQRVKRIGAPRPGGPSGPPRRPLAPPPSARRSRFPRALIIVFGLILVGAVAAVLLVMTSSTGSSNQAASGNSSTSSNAQTARHHSKARVAPLAPAQVTVAVLNGTSTSNLAHDVSLKLANSGYKPGTIATATDQTQTATTVGYLPGQRRAAMIVARSLNLGATAIAPVTQSNRAVACPQASCTAMVVVTVGSDLASAATTSQAPSAASSSTTG